MFDLQERIDQERARRDHALEGLKGSAAVIAEDAQEKLETFRSAESMVRTIRNHPISTCAVAVGAGVLIARLLRGTATPSTPAQRLVIEVQQNGKQVEAVEKKESSLTDTIVQGIAMLHTMQGLLQNASGMLQGQPFNMDQVAAMQPGATVPVNGNGAATPAPIQEHIVETQPAPV